MSRLFIAWLVVLFVYIVVLTCSPAANTTRALPPKLSKLVRKMLAPSSWTPLALLRAPRDSGRVARRCRSKWAQRKAASVEV
jgi:hypothetical protein